MTALSITEWTEAWAHKQGLACARFAELDSTNSYAKNQLQTPGTTSNLLLFLADYQTQGRGRGSNTWTSPAAGLSLLSSWSTSVMQPLQPVFPPLVGLALFSAASYVWPQLSWALKAPNDLYIKDKKVAGILIENIAIGSTTHCIVGVGMNVFGTPRNLTIATDVFQELLLLNPHTQKTFREEWDNFLDLWVKGLHSALQHGVRDELSTTDAQRLTAALQLLPGSRVQKVDVDVQIHTADGIKAWHEL